MCLFSIFMCLFSIIKVGIFIKCLFFDWNVIYIIFYLNYKIDWLSMYYFFYVDKGNEVVRNS